MKHDLHNLPSVKLNPDWASLPLFDRSGWTRVRFGEVVENCNETCDPEEAGLERFVAMEHLEPGSLHVRSWGNVADGTTFTRRCRPGQVLFGKRRAYQRKVAVAEFEAVVSGDIYVLAPKVAQASSLMGHRQDVCATLLPFLCLSERFFQHAVGTSAGSLSPRTNWSSLASFEFDLPPLDQQRRIAEILWAVDEHLQTALKLEQATVEAKEAVLAEKLPRDGRFGADVECCFDLQSLCKEPITYGIVQAGPEVADGVPYIRVTDMTNGPLRLEGTLRTSPEIAARFKRSTVRKGEIVCALRGPAGLLKIVPPELDGANLTQGTARVSLNDDELTGYVLRAFESPFVKRQVSLQAKGSTFAELTLAVLRGIQIPVLKPGARAAFSKQLDALDSACSASSAAVTDCQKLLRELTNQFS